MKIVLFTFLLQIVLTNARSINHVKKSILEKNSDFFNQKEMEIFQKQAIKSLLNHPKLKNKVSINDFDKKFDYSFFDENGKIKIRLGLDSDNRLYSHQTRSTDYSSSGDGSSYEVVVPPIEKVSNNIEDTLKKNNSIENENQISPDFELTDKEWKNQVSVPDFSYDYRDPDNDRILLKKYLPEEQDPEMDEITTTIVPVLVTPVSSITIVENKEVDKMEDKRSHYRPKINIEKIENVNIEISINQKNNRIINDEESKLITTTSTPEFITEFIQKPTDEPSKNDFSTMTTEIETPGENTEKSKIINNEVDNSLTIGNLKLPSQISLGSIAILFCLFI